MRSSRSTIKEPLGKKASGLGKLMSALHQNASSLVTSKPEQNGPNQVLPATEYITSRRNICVKLRKEETGLGAEEPISVPSLIQDLAELYPEVIALKIRGTEAGTWKTWNYNQLYEEIQVVGRAFIETGLQRHHSVAIIGANSPEWIICNMAAIMAGGISVGIQTSLTADEIAKVALDSKADIIVVDQEHQLKKVLLIQHKLPECKAIILIQGEPSIADKRRLHRTHRKHILSWASLQELGQSLSETRLDDRQRRIAINQCCSLVYSSGSHSTPKGVMFSHDNLTWSAKMALGFIRAPGFNRSPAPGEEVLISYLPLSHISTQILDIYYCMTVAGTLVFPSSNILHDGDMFFQEIKTIQPTILYGPPVIFERIYHRLVHLRRSVSGVERFFLDWSNGAVSQKHLQNHSGLSLPGAKPSGSTKIGDIQSKIAKNTVCKKYKESLGLCPNTLYLCRGGPLQDRLLRFLSGFDIVVHSGYGQSETTSFLAANIPKRFNKFSTVGKPVPGVKLKIEKMEDSCAAETKGAVLGYGRNIFMGYLNKENENQSKLTDDYWLKLGDQGALDDEGFLLVYGQVQDQIVMASGEVVNPSNIEGNLRLELPCISSCIVVGHGTDRLGALLSLDTVTDENGSPSNILTPQTVNWFRDARFDVKTIKDVVDNLDSGLKHVIQAGIDRANQLVITSCRMIVEWRVLPISFSVGTGELGPTLIIRRSLIQDKFSVHIQQLLTQEETRKHSFTDSIGGDSTATASEQPEAGHPYPHHLHQIIEEEERSNRNSVDKDMDQIGNTENVNNNNGAEIKETKEEKNEEKLIEDETKSEEEEVEIDEKKKNSEASEEDDEDLTGEDSGKKFEERRISENMALQDKMSIKKKISRK